MSQKFSIQLKAGFLLLVFSLNTMVGFACAVGLDMGFNTTHHDVANTGKIKEIHVQDDGSIHPHSSASSNEAADKHESGAAHHHGNDVKVPVKQEKDGKSLAGKNEKGCCSDEALKFQSLDKNLNQTTNNIVDAQVFVAMLSTFFGVDLITITKEVPSNFKARFYYPPPADILLATQRFQI